MTRFGLLILAALSVVYASPVPGLHIHTGGYGYHTVPYQDLHYSHVHPAPLVHHVHPAPLVHHVHSAPLVHTYPAPVVHSVHSVHSTPVVTSYKVKQHYHIFGK